MRPVQFSCCSLLAICVVLTFDGHARGDQRDEPVLVAPNGIVRLPDGSLLISDIQTHRILHLDSLGRLTMWGGTGQPSYSGDGKHVSQAAFHAPHDLKLDVVNNAVLVADSNNHRIRRVDLQTLTTSTLAGNGRSELSGDEGPADRAGLNNPQGIAVDHDGNIIIADTYNHVVRRIGTNGIMTTVAGSTPGLSGDGGPATSAQLSLPMAVAFSSDSQTIFISDAGNSRIRRVSPEGIIETVCGVGAGSGEAGAGFSGDGELATQAKIFSALDIAVVSPSVFYLSDSGNNRLRAVVHGIITTIAGTGPIADDAGIQKDNSESLATLFVPAKLTFAPDGGIYFCDRGNRRVRLLTKDGKIETLPIRTGPLPLDPVTESTDAPSDKSK